MQQLGGAIAEVTVALERLANASTAARSALPLVSDAEPPEAQP